MKSISEKTIRLYDELQKHTIADCNKFCNTKTCCVNAYCERTQKFARETYGVELEPTGHPTLLFMTDTGCSVAPHLRPECTEYVCCIRDHGGRSGDPVWTEKYYALRRKILFNEILEKAK